jgi:hypothetical protein
MDNPAIVSGLMGSDVILRLQYYRRKAPFCHSQSRGEADDSATNYDRTIGI